MLRPSSEATCAGMGIHSYLLSRLFVIPMECSVCYCNVCVSVWVNLFLRRGKRRKKSRKLGGNSRMTIKNKTAKSGEREAECSKPNVEERENSATFN
ncbi:hypothetical protein POVWA2_046610 [Plasmodium ovale wallikeri]|uniref:Uncharacterized protein n=1 Tax=Plasmodium ovale wallikeri TaxID=864142 RepID=A0A1A8ZHJ5_PLAOA|nr:hypothetical protein POVWA1_047670 [Plasmodium ovale wallikeri]SBT43826.1 hypothetical protein POVWA2_046610 [Plasmodium ovale wallikeri]